MPSFGNQSLEVLATVDDRLKEICREVIKVYDFKVVCGHRDKEDQEKAFKEGKTKKHFPDSKHNKDPSTAIDIYPYPIDFNDRERFVLLAGLMIATAESKGYILRWGGAWNGLKTMKNNKFDDLPHFEII